MRNVDPVYALPARTLHWAVALLVLAVIPAGFIMMNLPSGPAQNQVFDLHRSIGILIFALAVIRVGVRLAYQPPGRPPHMPRLQWAAAEAVHYALYALILVMPILGWLASNTFGSTVRVFGLFDLPNLMAKDEALSEKIGGLHAWLGLLMTALLAGHIGAALWHGIVRRDGVVSRMLPFLSR